MDLATHAVTPSGVRTTTGIASMTTSPPSLYTRTVYATGDPADLDQTLDALRSEAVGLLSAQPGYLGYGLFADRQVGKLIMGSWWESEQARRNSDEKLRERRTQLLSPFAGTVTTDDWEAPAYVRPAKTPSANGGFRLVRFDFDGSQADRMIEAVRDVALPGLQKIDGFVSGALFINRTGGRGTLGAIFTDLAGSRSPQAKLRAKSVPAAGVTIRSIEEFEVVLVDIPANA